MANGNGKCACILQNLEDAGCGEELTENCMNAVKNGRSDELLRLLTEYRADLLKRVHNGQKQLDCLDYLIYQTEKSV